MSNPLGGDDDVEARVESTAKAIEGRLRPSLTPKGKIDLDDLKAKDAELAEVLERFAHAKTWRDDPTISARDVAKLLEAQARATPLGNALDKLNQSLGR